MREPLVFQLDDFFYFTFEAGKFCSKRALLAGFVIASKKDSFRPIGIFQYSSNEYSATVLVLNVLLKMEETKINLNLDVLFAVLDQAKHFKSAMEMATVSFKLIHCLAGNEWLLGKAIWKRGKIQIQGVTYTLSSCTQIEAKEMVSKISYHCGLSDTDSQKIQIIITKLSQGEFNVINFKEGSQTLLELFMQSLLDILNNICDDDLLNMEELHENAKILKKSSCGEQLEIFKQSIGCLTSIDSKHIIGLNATVRPIEDFIESFCDYSLPTTICNIKKTFGKLCTFLLIDKNVEFKIEVCIICFLGVPIKFKRLHFSRCKFQQNFDVSFRNFSSIKFIFFFTDFTFAGSRLHEVQS